MIYLERIVLLESLTGPYCANCTAGTNEMQPESDNLRLREVRDVIGYAASERDPQASEEDTEALEDLRGILSSAISLKDI